MEVEEDRRKRRRVRQVKWGERREGEDATAWLARAYAELGIAQAQLARARMAVGKAVSQAENEEE